MEEQALWVEKYRPHKIEDCILPGTLKETFQTYVDRKEIPNLLLTGTAGTGKTTIAKALCEEVGCDYIVINGSNAGRHIETVRVQIQNYASSVSLSGGRKVIIIDEADYMNVESVQPALRAMIEEFALNCAFIFTCNNKNKIIAPIQSRCAVIDFKIEKSEKAKIASTFLKRVEYILSTEGVTYAKTAVVAVIMKFFPDNRRIINELQRYASTTDRAIDAGIVSIIAELNIKELVVALKEKDFGVTRRWVTNNVDAEMSVIMRQIYDQATEILQPQSVPTAILIMAKYQYQSAFVADHELNLMAFLIEIMMECEFV
jgi:DNA polymerase III delta prime subunit